MKNVMNWFKRQMAKIICQGCNQIRPLQNNVLHTTFRSHGHCFSCGQPVARKKKSFRGGHGVRLSSGRVKATLIR